MREWVIEKPEKGLVKYLSEKLSISEISSILLVNRGIVEPHEAERFLYPDMSLMDDPFSLPDMEKAVERVIEAIKRQEKIVIYGDYDADGVTSVAVLNMFFEELGVKSYYYIPHREREGYGIHEDAVKCFHSLGMKLLISVDCGTTDGDKIGFAREKGIDTIILDHHEIKDEDIPAYAFVNPKRSDSKYPFRELAGVGVVFNFIAALRKRLEEKGERGLPHVEKYLDLVALGTLADMVPLLDQNRIFVKHGLELIRRAERPGIRALKEVSGLGKNVDTFGVTYQLIPRINAAGRMGSARKSVELLTTPCYEEAQEIAKFLNRKNSERQAVEDRIMREIKGIIEKNPEVLEEPSLVFCGENWHTGVVGIVASRLVEEYGKPSIVLSMKNGRIKGSGRSVDGVNLYEALKGCESFLEKFGGHKLAAGLTVKPGSLKDFKESFNRFLRNRFSHGIPRPRIRIDTVLPLSSLDFGFISREYELFAPFGPKNPRPVFLSKDVIIRSAEFFGRGNVRMRVEHKGKSFQVVGFKRGGWDMDPPFRCSMVYSISFNDYLGERYLRIEVEDIKS